MGKNFYSFFRMMLVAVLLCCGVVSYADELTVNDGTITSACFPLYGYYGDTNGSRSEFVVPASALGDIPVGSSINSLLFYSTSSYSSVSWTGTFSVSLAEASNASLSSAFIDGTEVYSGTLSVVSNQMSIVFSTPYVYGGADLAISVLVSAKGNCPRCEFYGVNGVSGSARYYTYSATASTFNPKTTISYEPANVSCPKPGAIVKDSVADDFANIHWAKGGDEASWEVQLIGNGTTVTSVVTDTFTTLSGLRAYTDYQVKVCAICSATDSSRYVSTSFKTQKACKDMGAVAVLEVSTSDSLRFRWNSVADVEGYECVLMAGDAAVDESLAVAVADTVVGFDGLSSDSPYTLYVRTSCGGAKRGEWKSVSARTSCSAITASAWSENFETANTLNCWTLPTGVTRASSVSYALGSYALQFATTSDVVVVLPEFEDLSGKRFSFYYRAEGTGTNTTMGFFTAGYLTDASNNSSFVALGEQLPRVYAMTRVEYDLASVPAGARLAIRYKDATGSSWFGFVDNVTVDPMPTCRPGKNFSNSAVGAHSATLTWSAANGETEWQLKYKLTGDSVTHVVNVTDTTYQVVGLDAAKSYTGSAVLHAVCDGELSPDSLTLSLRFTTNCELFSLPYSENFDAVTAGTGVLPSCYSAFQYSCYYYGTYTTPDVYNSSYYTHSGSNCIRFYPYNATATSSELMLILPAFDESFVLTNSRISFWYKNYSENASYGRFVVGTMSDKSDASTFHPLDTLDQVSSYTQYELYLTEAVPTDSYIAIRYIKGTGSYDYSHYIDDIAVSEIPSCRPSKDIHVDNITMSTADINWSVANGETEWKLKYKPSTATEYTVADLTTNSLRLSNLEAGTRYSYNVILYSVCEGALSVDSVVKTLSFATECEEVVALDDTIRYVAESALGPCYTTFVSEGTSTAAWHTSNSYKYGNEAYSFYVYSPRHSVLALPMTEIPEDAELLFQASEGYSHYDSDTLRVWLNDSASLTGATLLGTVTFPATVAWDLCRFRLPEGGHGKYIMLEGNAGATSYGSFYVGDLHIAPAPTCQPATDLVLSSFTTESVTFSWAAGADEAAWNLLIEGGLDSIAEGSIYDENAVEETTYTLEGLEANTTYALRVSVQSDCGDGNEATELLTGTYTFKTLCNAFDLPFSENFDDLETVYSIPDCWDRSEGTTSSDSYKWGKSTAGYNSTNCVGFDSYANSSGNTNFLKTPLINAAEPVRMSFKWCNATGGDLSVYYSIDGGDMVLLKSGMKSNSSWTTETFDIPDSEGHQVQVIFKGTSNFGNISSLIRIDDVEIAAQPACVAVRDLKATDITTTSARIAWTAGRNETEWSLVIRQNTDTLLNTTTTTPYFDIDTLSVGTAYSYKVTVKSICDGAVAEEFLPEQTIAFATECEAFQLSPSAAWSDGFDSYDTYVSLVSENVCYSETSSASNYWCVGTTYKNSGSKGLYRYYTGKANTDILSLPLMNIPAANEYEFKFALYRSSSYYNDSVAIYLSDNTEIPAGAPLWVSKVKYSEDVVEKDYGWYDYSVTLPAAGEKHVLVVVYGKASSQSIYLDDFRVRKIPSCAGATALHAIDSVSTTSSVTFAWSGNAAEYVVSYASADSAYYNTVIVSDTAYTITGLPSSKTYSFNAYVVSKCSDSDFAVDTVSASFTVSTLCELISSLPWVEDFESTESGSGIIPNCFSSFQYSYSSTKYPYVNTGSSAYEGNKCLYFYNYYSSSTTKQMIVTPEFSSDVDLTNSRVTFYYKNYGTSTTSGQFVVGTMSDPSDFSTFHPLDTAERTVTYTKYELSLTNAPTTDHYVAIRLLSNGSYDYSHYIDNLAVTEIPTCFPGTNLHAVDSLATLHSATIGWTPYDAENLNAHIVVTKGTTVLADAVVNDSVYTITDLSSAWGTNVKVSVNTICGTAESTDALSATLAIHTLCEALSALPWTENFDNSPYMGCWTLPSGVSIYAPSSADYVKSGTSALRFATTSDVVAILPEFTQPLADLQMNFAWRCEGSTNTSMGYIEAGYITNPSDPTTFVAVYADATHKYTYQSVEVTFPASVPADARIAFRYYGASSESWYLFVDDVTVKMAPACHKPSSLTATPSTDQVVLTWGGNSSAYDILVKNGNDTLACTQVADASLTITGLTPATVYAYNVMIQGLCGTDSSAVYTSAISFTTECTPVATLPWTEGFEAATASQMPLCWEKVASPTIIYPYVIESSSDSHNGSKYLFSYGGISYYRDEFIILPEFAADVNTTILSFYYKQTYTSSAYMVPQVGVMLSASDTASFVSVATLTASTDYSLQEVDLAAAPAGYHFIAIKLPATASNANGYMFDDFEVKAAPTCHKPGEISIASITETDVTFAWTSTGEEAQWLVKRTVGGVVEDSVLVSAPNYTWGNLLSNTKYTCTLSVQAYCSEEDQSEARVNTFTFRTVLSADATESLAPGQTFTADFSDAEEQTKWQIFGDAETNHFVFGTVAAALVPGATTGLYITNTTDGSNAYAYTTTTAAAAAVVRHFHIGVDSATVRVRLNWKANGESNYDYGRVFWAADSVEVSVASHYLNLNTQHVAPGVSYYESTTVGATALQDSAKTTSATKLNIVSTWQTIDQQITLSTHGDYKLVIGWGNDSSSGTQSPLAVGNVEVSLIGGVVPTSLDGIDADDSETAVKFIHDGHVYIRFRGVIYNSLGQMVSSLH